MFFSWVLSEKMIVEQRPEEGKRVPRQINDGKGFLTQLPACAKAQSRAFVQLPCKVSVEVKREPGHGNPCG